MKNRMNLKGVSLITLVITIVVIIIISTITILTISNSDIIGNAKEANYKSTLKSYDDEIKVSLASQFIKDPNILKKTITEKEEIAKYSRSLADSDYIDKAYISNGVLTLKGNSITLQERNWAIEIGIKIDNIVEVTDNVIITLSTDSWINGNVSVGFNYDDIPEGYTLQYKIGSGEWVDGNSYTTDSNVTVYGRLYNILIDHETAINTKNIVNIDKENPTIPTDIAIIENINSIAVTASGSTDSDSGVIGYQYSIDNVNWSELVANGTAYTFSNIKSGTESTVYAKAVDRVGLLSEIYNKNAATATVTNSVDIQLSTDSWTNQNVTATFSYSNIPTGYTIQYKITGGSWTTGTSKTVEANTTINARLYNSNLDDEIATNSKNVANIDKQNPTAPTDISVTENINSIVVTASGSTDALSGVVGYKYSIDNVNWSELVANGTAYTFNNIKSGTENTVYAKAVDRVGLLSEIYNKNATTTTVTNSVNINLNNEEWTNQNVTATFSYSSIPTGYTIQYKITGGSWTTGTSKVVEANTTINVRLYNSNLDDEIATNSKNVVNIDKENPTKPTNISVTENINSIVATASGSTDALSGVAGYQYSIDNVNWSELVANGTAYTFSNIKSGTQIAVYARAVDATGLLSNVYDKNTATATVTNSVGIQLSTDSWTNQNVTATFSYSNIPTGYAIQYKITGGSWTTGTSKTVEANTTINARLYNSNLDDEIATNSKNVANIDKEQPKITGYTSVTSTVNSITITGIVASDTGVSGIKNYKYFIKKSTDTQYTPYDSTATSYTFSSLTQGTTYNIIVRAYDNAGNDSLSPVRQEISLNKATVATYTISYDTNGGSSAPAAQTKTQGTTLKLSTTVPTKTGYAFLGWSTSKTATSATYAAGANYTANSAATLYAVWKANTYTITYDANGGNGAPTAQTKTHGVNLTLSSTIPTRTGYTFLGWSTSKTATSATYAAGANYTANSAATLYAVWKFSWPTLTTRVTFNDAHQSTSNNDYGDVYVSNQTLQLNNNISDDGTLSYYAIIDAGCTVNCEFTKQIITSSADGDLSILMQNNEGIDKNEIIGNYTTSGGNYGYNGYTYRKTVLY